MKKLLLLLAILPLMMVSCSDDLTEIEGGEETNGGIVLNVNLESGESAYAVGDVDLTGYSLTIEGPTNISNACPGDGIIKDLKAGSGYTVSLTNMPENYSASFDDPRYTGSKTAVSVSAGANTPVTITLSRVNAGVYFEYDKSLAENGFTDLTPVVAMGDDILTYDQDESERKGYFAPGTFTVTLKNGDDDIELGGKMTQTLDAGAKQMWRVVLYAADAGDGSLTVNATLTERNDPDNSKSWTKEVEPPAEGKFHILGYEETDIVLTYSDDTTENLTVSENGNVAPTETDKVIKSIQKADGPEILIGRKAGEQINIHTDGTNLITRDPEGDTYFAGTYGELTLIEQLLDKSWKQDANIDLMNLLFVPLAKTGPFTGHYDGNGFSISNMRIDMFELQETDPSAPLNNTGFFRWVDGVVENLNIESGSVRAQTEAAGIAGHLMGGTLKNCRNAAEITSTGDCAGGITAMAYGNSTIEDCFNTGNVSVTGQAVGGIFASTPSTGVADKRANLKNCVNEGTIIANYVDTDRDSGQLAGGIVGSFTAGTMQDCTNRGTVRGRGMVGGIVGYNNLPISGMRNEGDVYGETGAAGGIVGQHQGQTSYRDLRNSGKVINGPDSGSTGGIIGNNSHCNGYDLVNTGEISGGNNTGGIMGGAVGANIVLDNCYNTGNISGKNYVGGLYGESGGTSHVVTKCYNTGTISGTGNQIGGLMGHQNGLRMEACYSTGNVSGVQYVGCLVGFLENAYTRGCYAKGNATGTKNVGGLTGRLRHWQGTLSLYACYHVGTVTATEGTNAGGVAGLLDGGVLDCYWSGNQTESHGSKASKGSIADSFYFNDGTAPNGVTTGWPANDAAKHWGVGTPDTGEGYWWKSIGTSGSATYPTLYWQ